MLRFRTLLRDTQGAITIDWVVITAVVAGLAFGVLALVWGGVDDVSSDVSVFISTVPVEPAY